MEIKDHIESDALGEAKGLDFAYIVRFEADICEHGPDGTVYCRGEKDEVIRFEDLPFEDRLQIIEACIQRYARHVDNSGHILDEP